MICSRQQSKVKEGRVEKQSQIHYVHTETEDTEKQLQMLKSGHLGVRKVY